jgi:hypothetical protein
VPLKVWRVPRRMNLPVTRMQKTAGGDEPLAARSVQVGALIPEPRGRVPAMAGVTSSAPVAKARTP